MYANVALPTRNFSWKFSVWFKAKITYNEKRQKRKLYITLYSIITLQAYKLRYFWAGRVRLQMRRLFRLSSSCLLARTIRNKGKGHNPIRDISTAKKKSFLKVEKWLVVYLKKKVVNILFTRLFRTWRVNFNLWTDGTYTVINSSWGRSTLLSFVLRFTCLHVRLYRILL